MINICIIATIVIYLVGMLLVGFVYSKSNEDSSDFYLGGRTMGPLVTAMSAEASDMSSWLLMGMPGLAYLTGIASPGWTAIGLAVGTWLNWLIVARRLRRYSANLDAITVPQFLSLRFHDQRNLLNALGAVIIIVFFIPYTASGFAACGKLFNSLFGVDYMAAMVLSAVVIVGYTIMGGFRAVSTTDLIQSVVMSMALIAVLVYGVNVAGGWDVVLDNARSLPGYLTMAASHNAADNTATSYSLLDIASTLAWGLGYFGMPHILLRFMAIEDEKKLVLSRRIASVWVVIAMTASIVIGMVGLGMTKAGALEFLSGSSSETLIVRVASLIAQHGVLAAILAGLIPCRHPCRYHVHRRQPDAGSGLQRIPEHPAGVRPHEADREAEPVRCPPDHHLHQCGGRGAGPRPQLQRVRHRQLCMGRLWRLLWRSGAVLPVLEALQLAGRTGRYALRRPDGLCMEVHHQPAGRRVWHLRAAACLPDVSGGLCCGEPCHPGTLGRDRGRVRRCQVKTILKCPPLCSGHSSGKMIDPYAKEQSRRALLFCFFTGWGRRGKRHLIQKNQPCFAAWKQKSKTEKEQKIQHEPHQTGKRRAERHGVNDKKDSPHPSAGSNRFAQNCSRAQEIEIQIRQTMEK